MKAVTINRIISYFVVPVAATLIFVVFMLTPVQNWFAAHIPHPIYRLVIMALIFFVFIYIVNRLAHQYLKSRLYRYSGKPRYPT